MTSGRRAFGALEVCRLWLSYQRYSFLLLAMAAGVIAAVALYDATAWYLWLAAAVPVIKLGQFTVEVYGRWPRKLRATALAVKRIEAGRFSPRFVENYCGDPCFRVVAREILSRAGVSRAQRRRLIREYARQAKERSNVILMVNRETGVEVRVGGGRIG
jgi:hypothetical protein